MKEFWSRRIRDAVPYIPGEQPRDRTFIKLNTNENPYPPSPKVVEAIRETAGELRLYPDPNCTRLRQVIAEREGLSIDQVFCSNGSDEALAFAFQAFFDPDRSVLFPSITYSFYPVYSNYFGIPCRKLPMGPDFSVPLEGLCGGDSGGVVLANPNAPTGMAVGLDVVERVLDANPGVVVIVDEAYVDFGASSAVPLIDRHPNLLVVQTSSKSRALAGLRVGWAMGNPNLIAGLQCVQGSINSYTVDRLAQAGAIAAIQDEAYFQELCQLVINTRERTAQALRALGFTVLPSQANFLFARCPGRSSKELLDGLRQQGILVRWWDQPELRDWLRISIGTDEQMETLIQVLSGLI